MRGEEEVGIVPKLLECRVVGQCLCDGLYTGISQLIVA